MNEIISVVRTISQILTAGIAITAFALLLYSLTFNLKHRVARVLYVDHVLPGGCFLRRILRGYKQGAIFH